MEVEFETGFIKNNHYSVESHDEEKVVVKAELTDSSLNPYGMAHGGFIFGLGDTAMGLAVYLSKQKALTVSANISYLKAAKGEYLKAEGRITKAGNKICFTEAKIYNDNNELVATMTGNYYVLD